MLCIHNMGILMEVIIMVVRKTVGSRIVGHVISCGNICYIIDSGLVNINGNICISMDRGREQVRSWERERVQNWDREWVRNWDQEQVWNWDRERGRNWDWEQVWNWECSGRGVQPGRCASILRATKKAMANRLKRFIHGLAQWGS